MSTISQSVLDKLRDDIAEVVSFWNTISTNRNLRSELSAADVLALVEIIKQRDMEESLLYSWRPAETAAVSTKNIPDISEFVAVEMPPIKKPKGKKK